MKDLILQKSQMRLIELVILWKLILEPSISSKKHTALGRFKHENAEVVLSNNAKVVVYMGDDEKGEYIYKYVSNNKYEKKMELVVIY